MGSVMILEDKLKVIEKLAVRLDSHGLDSGLAYMISG